MYNIEVLLSSTQRDFTEIMNRGLGLKWATQVTGEWMGGGGRTWAKWIA